MKTLISAPLNFIDDSKIKKYQDLKLIINPLKDFDSIKKFKKDNIIAWMVNPCPEYFVSSEILSSFKHLKIIVTPSTGSTHIDNDYCKNNGIIVKTLRDTNVTKTITASSEFTLALFLNVIRNFPNAINNTIPPNPTIKSGSIIEVRVLTEYSTSCSKKEATEDSISDNRSALDAGENSCDRNGSDLVHGF